RELGFGDPPELLVQLRQKGPKLLPFEFMGDRTRNEPGHSTSADAVAHLRSKFARNAYGQLDDRPTQVAIPTGVGNRGKAGSRKAHTRLPILRLTLSPHLPTRRQRQRFNHTE